MTKEQFKIVTDWQAKTFPAATSLSKIHHLKQEITELYSDLMAQSADRRLEFADCFMLLFGAAKADGMTYEDITNAIAEKLTINLRRQWGKPDENGVVNHIK